MIEAKILADWDTARLANGPRVSTSTAVTADNHSRRRPRSVNTCQTAATGASIKRVTATVDIE